MTQMKEQIKTPEKQLRETEIDNLSDAEFSEHPYDSQSIPWVWQKKKKG